MKFYVVYTYQEDQYDRLILSKQTISIDGVKHETDRNCQLFSNCKNSSVFCSLISISERNNNTDNIELLKFYCCFLNLVPEYPIFMLILTLLFIIIYILLYT